MSKGNSKINVYATQVFIVVLSGRCNPSPKLIGGCMIFLNHVSKWINKKTNTNKQTTKKEKKNNFIFFNDSIVTTNEGVGFESRFYL